MLFPNYKAYKVTSPFGMRTLNGVRRMHNGIDLVAKRPDGSSATDYIAAHTGGTVAAAGYNASCGNFVNIQCGDVLMVYYHLKDTPALKKGDKVEAGQVIGYMGATGNVTGAHLHFGIRKNGQWIDPAPYLEEKAAAVEEKYNEIPLKTLISGARGESVRSLQILLSGRGCKGNMHAPDGRFGPNTLGAVKLFQEKSGLEADGIVGRLTWSALLGVG